MAEQLSLITAPIIFNGTFTLHNTVTGNHRTLRIRTQKKDAKFAPGERIISLLTGPDNVHDYKGFGFVKDDGITVWKKHRGRTGPSDMEKLATILWSIWTLRANSPYVKAGVTMIQSCRCRFCNRKLTDSLSAMTGIGPECSAARGIDRERLPKLGTVEANLVLTAVDDKDFDSADDE